MDARDAAALIAPAVAPGGVWADLGAGMGTFTEALATLVGANGTVYAVEREAHAVRALEALARRRPTHEEAPLIVRRADFTVSLDLPTLRGALVANALHFVADDEQSPLLVRIERQLEPDGVIVVVEYDDRPRSRWVPYPVSLTRLEAIARSGGLASPELIGRRHSAFGGTMYAARIAKR